MKAKTYLEVISFYKNRITEFSSLHRKYKWREILFPYFRFLLSVTFIIPLYLYFSTYNIIYVVISILLLLLFLTVLYLHDQLIKKLKQIDEMISLNKNELNILEHGISNEFDSGKEFVDESHSYASDLDIFGNNSLFQYINRATTFHGRKKLSQWLKAPANIDDIYLRQASIKEISDNTSWMQQYILTGKSVQLTGKEIDRLCTLANQPAFLLNKKFFLSVVNLLTLGMFFVIIASLLGYVSLNLVLFFGIFNFIISHYYQKRINSLHAIITDTSNTLTVYRNLLILIENKEFQSSYLVDIRSRLKSSKTFASTKINRLSNIVSTLDLRFNPLINIPLNLLLFWNTRYIVKAEKWINKHGTEINNWFNIVGEVDALVSLGNLRFNHPECSFPKVNNNYFSLKAVNISHPLIPYHQRVYNSFTIPGPGIINIITGANMSGKSTFLKTIGTNIVLALAGAPVYAQEFSMSTVLVYTSLKTTDSLANNISAFEYETIRLKKLLSKIKRRENIFVLLDEVFKTTNPKDKLNGSRLLVKVLIELNTSGVIATHDFELTNMSENMPENIKNYYFDYSDKNKKMKFNYQLKSGVCKTSNALLIIKDILFFPSVSPERDTEASERRI